MQTINQSAVKTLHRLLFRALVEMRAEGHEQKDKLVFHLADLFHNIVLEMENAAEGEKSYDEVLALLIERASQRGLQRWLESALAQIQENEANHQSGTKRST